MTLLGDVRHQLHQAMRRGFSSHHLRVLISFEFERDLREELMLNFISSSLTHPKLDAGFELFGYPANLVLGQKEPVLVVCISGS